MTVYSGTSPFSRGKLGGARGIGMKMSRGGAKKRFRLRERTRGKDGQSVERTGSATQNVSSGKGGGTSYTLGMTTSGQGLIKSVSALSLTSSGGFGTYDALGIVAGGGSPIGYVTVTCGTDFTNANTAFADKKNVKISFFQRDAGTFTGFLDRDSFFRYTYKVFFPEITSVNVLSDNVGQPNSLTIKFVTE